MTTINLTSTTASGYLESDNDQIKSLINGNDTGDLAQVSTNVTNITNIETKTDLITVTQSVNLDTIESDTITNNAKVGVTDEIPSDPSGVTGADAITNIISLTTAEYGAIGTPNASTVYIITDA